MDGDHTPSTLHEELHEEARGRQGAFGGGEDPGRNEDARHDGGDEHGAAAADPLGEVADDSAADACTGLHEDAGASGGCVGQFFLGEHEGCVAKVTVSQC